MSMYKTPNPQVLSNGISTSNPEHTIHGVTFYLKSSILCFLYFLVTMDTIGYSSTSSSSSASPTNEWKSDNPISKTRSSASRPFVCTHFNCWYLKRQIPCQFQVKFVHKNEWNRSRKWRYFQSLSNGTKYTKHSQWVYCGDPFGEFALWYPSNRDAVPNSKWETLEISQQWRQLPKGQWLGINHMENGQNQWNVIWYFVYWP